MDITFKSDGDFDPSLTAGNFLANHRMALKDILFVHLSPVPLVIRRLPGAENPHVMLCFCSGCGTDEIRKEGKWHLDKIELKL